jgi:two-component system NtrC family sensor kinase
LWADASTVKLCIANTGTPLTEEAFKETLTAESGRDPRGFGLWVCQELASHYQGGFELDTSHTKGTRLIFWLPNREPKVSEL